MLDVGQKMIFVGNVPDSTYLFRDIVACIWGRNMCLVEIKIGLLIIIFEVFIDRKRIKRLRLKTTFWRHC